METCKPDHEDGTVVTTAKQLRFALAQREDVVRPIRERYDRSLRDPRMMPAKRAEIAAAFIQTAYRADHVYEEYLDRAMSHVPAGHSVG